MTQDDKLTRFLGVLADHKDELGLAPGEFGFAEDNRFTFNLSSRMRAFANQLFYKYGPTMGINHLDEPIPKEITVDLANVRKAP
jgi:hypothetical protein